MTEIPKVTIVIPTRDRPDLIPDAIESVLASEYPAIEVLVTDQSRDHRTRYVVERIASDHPNLHYFASTTVGSSTNRNIGAALSGTEFIAYTDDDCVVQPYWVNALMTEFSQPDVAAVYGRVLPFSTAALTGAESAVRDGRKRIEYRSKAPPWYVGTGGNMAFRRAALRSIGGFDPLLGAGNTLRSCEDTDIAYRLLAAHRTVVYTPDAVTYHKPWKDWRSQKQMEHAYGVGAGAQLTKYVRCGDLYGLLLFCMWIWQHAVRRFGAGLFKWHNPRVLYLASCQLVYPWVGVFQSLQYSLDRKSMTFVDQTAAQGQERLAAGDKSWPVHKRS